MKNEHLSLHRRLPDDLATPTVIEYFDKYKDTDGSVGRRLVYSLSLFSRPPCLRLLYCLAYLRQRMLTYAHVCSRMLTYAHVCWRMVTYGDVTGFRDWLCM